MSDHIQGGLPSLFSPGKVVIQKWMTSADRTFIETRPGIEFVINFLQDLIPERRQVLPKKPASSPGERYLAFKSGTGSGKSTTLPPYLYRTFFEGLHKTIVMSEPRVMNCMSITDEIMIYNSDFKLGENIGYATGSFKKRPNKGIVVETVGVLLQQLKTLTDEEFMNKFFVVIIDEVHLRAVDNDLVMYYLKKMIERNYKNPSCPFVILTSGTFDEKLFMEYFDIPERNYIEVVGLSYPIQKIWPSQPIRELTLEIVNTIKIIHTSEEGKADIKNADNISRDILIVVDSTAMIDRICFEVHKLNLLPEISKVGYILPIPINSERFNAGGKQYQQLMSNISSIKGHLMKKEFSTLKVGGYGLESYLEIMEDDKKIYIDPDNISGGYNNATELLEYIK